MNRFATLFSASALSAIAFGAEGYAAMPAAGDTFGLNIESTLRTMSPKSVEVVRMDSLTTHDAGHERFGNVAPTSQEARQVQASVIANHPLARALQAQNVELTNILGAEQAADGAVTLYIR